MARWRPLVAVAKDQTERLAYVRAFIEETKAVRQWVFEWLGAEEAKKIRCFTLSSTSKIVTRSDYCQRWPTIATTTARTIRSKANRMRLSLLLSILPFPANARGELFCGTYAHSQFAGLTILQNLVSPRQSPSQKSKGAN